MTEERKSLNQIINVRKEKLNKIISKGINPYPPIFKPTHLSGEILSNFKTQEKKLVSLAGRIVSIRKMGKASFFHLQDSMGKIQIFIKKDDIGESEYENFQLLDIGDFVGIEGDVFKTKVGEISVKVKSMTILCKSIRPLPIVKEKEDEVYDAFTSKEMRYRNRHLDLIVNPQVRETFFKRTKIISSIRYFLDNLGFLEVETPVLQPIYGGANARPFTTYHNALDQQFYLRIADELYLKRLIVGGIDRVYEISKDFRNEGMDRNHNPEFTMLEFYQAYSDYEDLMNLTENMMRELTLNLFNTHEVTYQEQVYDLGKPFERLSLFESILKYNKTISDEDLRSLEKIRSIAKELDVFIEDSYGLGKIQVEIFEKTVESKLLSPTFITQFPTEVSPLARKNNDNPFVTDSLEFFIACREIAKGISELNDPEDQAERFRKQVEDKEAGDDEAMHFDDDYIKALEYGMPPTAGEGIGIDRLVMFLTDSASIRDVILFPHLRQK